MIIMILIIIRRRIIIIIRKIVWFGCLWVMYNRGVFGYCKVSKNIVIIIIIIIIIVFNKSLNLV